MVGAGLQAGGPWFSCRCLPGLSAVAWSCQTSWARRDLNLGHTRLWLSLAVDLSTKGLQGASSQRLEMGGRARAQGLPLCPPLPGAQGPHGLSWFLRWPLADTNVLTSPAAQIALMPSAGRSVLSAGGGLLQFPGGSGRRWRWGQERRTREDGRDRERAVSGEGLGLGGQ